MSTNGPKRSVWRSHFSFFAKQAIFKLNVENCRRSSFFNFLIFVADIVDIQLVFNGVDASR